MIKNVYLCSRAVQCSASASASASASYSYLVLTKL